MEALTTHLSGLAVAVVLRVARYSSAFSSLASALAVLRFFSAGGAEVFTFCPFGPSGVCPSGMGVDVGAGAATICGCCVRCAGCCGVGGGCGGWVCVGGVGGGVAGGAI